MAVRTYFSPIANTYIAQAYFRGGPRYLRGQRTQTATQPIYKGYKVERRNDLINIRVTGSIRLRILTDHLVQIPHISTYPYSVYVFEVALQTRNMIISTILLTPGKFNPFLIVTLTEKKMLSQRSTPCLLHPVSRQAPSFEKLSLETPRLPFTCITACLPFQRPL